jgi:hypothetical protein
MTDLEKVQIIKDYRILIKYLRCRPTSHQDYHGYEWAIVGIKEAMNLLYGSLKKPELVPNDITN